MDPSQLLKVSTELPEVTSDQPAVASPEYTHPKCTHLPIVHTSPVIPLSQYFFGKRIYWSLTGCNFLKVGDILMLQHRTRSPGWVHSDSVAGCCSYAWFAGRFWQHWWLFAAHCSLFFNLLLSLWCWRYFDAYFFITIYNSPDSFSVQSAACQSKTFNSAVPMCHKS